MNEQEQTIDLRTLFRVFTGHIIPIAAVTLFAAAVGFVLAFFIVPKQYKSETLMYVENSSSARDDASSININDINAAQKLVNTCQILFTSDYVFGELNSAFGGVYTNEQLGNMIKISSVNSTEVLRISVNSGSPQESYDVALKFSELAVKEFNRIIKGGSIETVSPPTYPLKHDFPSVTKFTLIGAAAGFVLVYIFFLLKEMLDVKIKPDDDLAVIYDIPVFAEIVDFEEAEKSGGKYLRYSAHGSSGSGDEFYPDGGGEAPGDEGAVRQ